MNPKADPNSPFHITGTYNGQLMHPDDFGNYNYGVSARALGLSPVDDLRGGGIGAFLLGGQHTWWNVFGLFDSWNDTKMIFKGYF